MGKEQDLLQAVKDQDVTSVEKFLAKYRSSRKIVGSAKKLNISQQDADGMSVLHHAALLGSVKILKLLLDYGAVVDATDAKGLRPLHYTAWQGHTHPTEILLHKGSSVDRPALEGNTPLHLACEHGHFDVVKKLLEYGANVCVTNGQHRMPLDLACEFGRTAVVERLLESDSCRGALQNITNDLADNDRTTCLHLAARNGHLDTIRLLLEAGIDVNRTTLQGTCLHEAAKYGKTDVVRLLLSCGIDVSLLNSYEQTALELVNKFTMTRAARELKQMLKEASTEIRVPSVCDPTTGSDCHSSSVFKETGLPFADQSSTTVGFLKSHHQNGLDSSSTGHATFFPPNVSRAVDSNSLTKKFGKPSHWNHSSPQPSPTEMSHIGGKISIEDEPSPHSPLYKFKASSHVNHGLLAHVIAHRFAESQNGNHPDNGHSKEGSNRMSGGSSGNGSYHSSDSQQSNGSHNRLSDQSYESGVSGISSSRQSCHSSGSSQGSLDHFPEESGYSSTVNVHELLRQGLSDADILRTWLSSMHLVELTSLFVSAGYDMPTISRMTPEDLTAIGITKPSMRKKLKSEIGKLSISDGIPDYRPKDLSDWLCSFRMDEYNEILVKQGFGTLDTVTDITWEDLEEIGIKKLGHQKKMMLAVDRLKRINTLLRRLSGSSQSSHSSSEGVNHYDSLVSSGKLPSRVSSSLSSASSSIPSFVSTSSRHHAASYEKVMPWKTENCSTLNERVVISAKSQSTSVEVHPVPLNKFPTNFSFSNMISSYDHNTYPALIENSSESHPASHMLTDAAADSVGNGGGLDGDATPTNERKLIVNIDGTKGCVRTNYSQEEPVDFYKADQYNMRLNALSSYSTLPKKNCGKRKVNDLSDSCGLGFSGFLNFEKALSSKKANCQPSQIPSAENAGLHPVSNGQKREPPPPPKRSDSFKTSILKAAHGNPDRLQSSIQNSSVTSHTFTNVSIATSENLNSIFTSNPAGAENKIVANSSMLSDVSRIPKSSYCENVNVVDLRHDVQPKQEATGKIINNHADLQDGGLSKVSDDSDSGLESRHSVSSASLDSSGSGGGMESNTLPFANENVGTIKQRNPSSKPSILTSSDGDGNELNRSLFENEIESPICKIQTNYEKDANANQDSQFTLVNGEIVNKSIINNGNLPYKANTEDLFNDIDGMLNGLTRELDEMLKFDDDDG